jgi:hypothetical protein
MKIKNFFIMISLVFLFTVCVLLLSGEPRRKALDLDLVSGYEFRIYSYEERTNTTYEFTRPEAVENINDFLGTGRSIEYNKYACMCSYDVVVRIFLTTGEILRYGVEKNRDDASFNFSANSMEIIRFDDRSYYDLIGLIESMGNSL